MAAENTEIMSKIQLQLLLMIKFTVILINAAVVNCVMEYTGCTFPIKKNLLSILTLFKLSIMTFEIYFFSTIIGLAACSTSFRDTLDAEPETFPII